MGHSLWQSDGQGVCAKCAPNLPTNGKNGGIFLHRVGFILIFRHAKVGEMVSGSGGETLSPWMDSCAKKWCRTNGLFFVCVITWIQAKSKVNAREELNKTTQ